MDKEELMKRGFTEADGVIRKMTKEEVYDFVKEAFESGFFTTYKQVIPKGRCTSYIDSLCVKRKYSYTTMSKVLFVGDRTRHPVFDTFERLRDEKRIMSTLEAKVYLGTPTIYKIHGMAEKGCELLRYEYDNIIIYIR